MRDEVLITENLLKIIQKWLKKDKAKKIILKSELTITLSNGSQIAWNNPVKNKSSLIRPWRNFYKWYFTKNTPYYVMRYICGQTMFLRNDIKTFKIILIKMEDEK